MAYSEELAARVAELLPAEGGVETRRMIGTLVWMIDGRMALGVLGECLVVRLSPAEAQGLLDPPGVRVFDFTGRPMRGWLTVASERLRDEDALADWVGRAARHAATQAGR